MARFDLCVAWNWVYDSDFISLLDAAFQERGLSLWPVTPDNLAEALDKLSSAESSFLAFLDRASEATFASCRSLSGRPAWSLGDQPSWPGRPRRQQGLHAFGVHHCRNPDTSDHHPASP